MSCKYDDYDWKELPKEVQEAAKKLGYDKVRSPQLKEVDTRYQY